MKLWGAFIGVVFCILVLSSIANAQPVDRTNLPPIGITNVIQFTLEAHPQAQIAEENVELAKQALRSSRADFKPGASANYNFSDLHNPVTSGLGNAQLGMAGFTLNQPLVNLASMFNYKAAKQRLEAAISTADADQLRVAANAALTYIEVLKLRITLDLASENYFFVKDLVTAMKTGEFKDRASPNDLMIADTVWGSSLNEKHKWMSEAEMSENNFIRDTHLMASDYFLVLPEVLQTPLTDQEAVQIASEKNPRFLAAKAQAEAAKRDVKAAQMSYLPRVDAFATAYDMQRPKGDFDSIYKSGTAVGVSVSVPLFDGKRGPNIASQKIKQNVAALQAVDQSANMSTAIKNIYVQNKQRQARLVGLCRGVRSGLVSVENMRAGLFTKFTVQELLIQKQQLLKTAVDLNNEILSEVVDSFNIQVQMGTLMENLPPPVEQINPGDPNPHHKGPEAYKGLLEHCEKGQLFKLTVPD